MLMFFSDDSCYACLSSLANSWFVLHTLRQSGVSGWLCFLTGAERIRHCCKCHSADGRHSFPPSMCVHEEVRHSLCSFYMWFCFRMCPELIGSQLPRTTEDSDDQIQTSEFWFGTVLFSEVHNVCCCVCFQGEEGPPSLEYIQARDLFPQKELVKEDDALQVSFTRQTDNIRFLPCWDPPCILL